MSVMSLSHYTIVSYDFNLILVTPMESCWLRWSWLRFDYNLTTMILGHGGIGFWVWAATILYPSSKHTALVKNSHQYALEQKVTLRLPLVSREVQPAIIPLKQHLLIKPQSCSKSAINYLRLMYPKVYNFSTRTILMRQMKRAQSNVNIYKKLLK